MTSEAINKEVMWLFSEFGIVGWTWGYNDRKHSVGLCRYRQRRIELNKLYSETAPDESVIDTIRHEVAHILAGQEGEYQHGPLWEYWACRVGATPRRCISAEVVYEQDTASAKYSATCGGCQRVFYKYRKIKTSRYCLKCGPERGKLTFRIVGS